MLVTFYYNMSKRRKNMNKFGDALRILRRRRQETLAEISGAIELM